METLTLLETLTLTLTLTLTGKAIARPGRKIANPAIGAVDLAEVSRASRVGAALGGNVSAVSLHLDGSGVVRGGAVAV